MGTTTHCDPGIFMTHRGPAQNKTRNYSSSISRPLALSFRRSNVEGCCEVFDAAQRALQQPTVLMAVLRGPGVPCLAGRLVRARSVRSMLVRRPRCPRYPLWAAGPP